jgi:hypothetical protein
VVGQFGGTAVFAKMLVKIEGILNPGHGILGALPSKINFRPPQGLKYFPKWYHLPKLKE